MKKFLLVLLLLAVPSISFAQTVFKSKQVGSLPVSGYYLQTDGDNSFWTPVSSTGGGADGNWSYSTLLGGFIRLATTTNRVGIGTTSPYAMLSVASNAVGTTTFALRPIASQTANILDIFSTTGILNSVITAANRFGIGTTSPYAPLSVVGQIVGGYFTATTSTASTFPSANITKLSNLTSNGFVKTGSSDGTLSVDTTTYESGLTAGDGLTRTVNDFDCDTASGSTFGCLSSTDWTTFNNKGSGTVTAVSVASSNGFAGSSSGGATPALTLSTSITGVLKGNGTAISAAANGTDYTLIAATTCGGTDKVSAISASGAVTCSADQSGTGGGSGNVATSSAETSGYVPFWTSTSATPATLGSDSGFQYNSTLDRLTVSYASTTALNVSGSLYNTSLADGCLNVTSGLIGSTGSACGAGGGGSGGGTWSTTTSTVSGQLTNYPNNDDDIVTIGSNSTTTAEFYFDPNTNTARIGLDTGFLGGKVYTNGLFDTKTQLMVTGAVNDLQSNIVLGNTYAGTGGADGAYAAGGLSLVNASSTVGDTFQTSTHYCYLGLAGPQFAAFSGLPANGYVQNCTDGPQIFGATSGTTTLGWMAWALGSGYLVSNYDMILKNVDSSYTNTASGGLGIGTSTPDSRITILASSTAPFNYLTIYQHVNGVTTGVPVFNVHKNENVGVASTTPWGRLSVNPNGITGPALVVGSSTKTTFVVDNGGLVGIGSTTPWAQLSVNPNGVTGPAFAVGSSTKTDFVVTNAGNVGIGTTSPVAPLHISDGNNLSSSLVSTDKLVMSYQGTAPGFSIISAASGAQSRGVFKAVRTNGTLASPTAVLLGDNTFSLLGAAYDGTVSRAE